MVIAREYQTIDTNLAAYLVHLGFRHLLIKYTDLAQINRRVQATHYFEETPELIKQVSLYNQGNVKINLIPYEKAKENLMDRIKRGLP
jgi:hypothetical protein